MISPTMAENFLVESGFGWHENSGFLAQEAELFCSLCYAALIVWVVLLCSLGDQSLGKKLDLNLF